MPAPRILVGYHSGEGHTAEIAQRIGAQLRAAGVTVEVATTDDAPPAVGYDAVVLGDSIHAGHHAKSFLSYAKANAAALAATHSALFQVSMTSSGHDDKSNATVHQYVADAVEATGWEPDLVGLFAGALVYTRYGWFKRHLMASIAKRTGLDTDMSHDVDLTDWEAVDAFTADIAALVSS